MDFGLVWKQEPASPLNYEEVYLAEEPFYQTTNHVVKKEHSGGESKAALASHILDDLENLMDLDDLIKEEEPFLLDVKMLPMLEEVEPPRAVPVPSNKYPKDTQSLINEFQSVYDGFNHAGALTPPQSPPLAPMLHQLEPLLHAPFSKQTAPHIVPEKLSLDLIEPDIAHELAVVDELVRTRVEDMHWPAPSSPSSSSSCSSNFGDCSSDDPEWVPEAVDQQAAVLEASAAPRKRSKPYARHHPEEKKVRKKEQNKNAATRYRLKKKAEVEEILGEEKQLLDHHSGLETDITDLQREIKYLKGLMRDLFKAKGLIN